MPARPTPRTSRLIATIGDLIGLITVTLIIPVSWTIIAYAAAGH